MKNKTIILFGASGYIGSEFVKQMVHKQIPFISIKNSKNVDYHYLKKNIIPNQDYIFVNAAGFTGKPNVDTCESHRSETIAGNILLSATLTNYCQEYNIPLLHISSGCIYNGYSKIYNETDEPNFTFIQNNCSFYSGSKAIAEDVVKKYPKHYIFRLRIPFEHINNSRNYISKLLNYKILLDVKNSITNKQEFVSACLDGVAKEIPYGIYNVTNTGYISTKDVVRLLKKNIGKNHNFEFYDNFDDFYARSGVKCPRSNCILDNSKIINAGIKIKDVNESIEWCIKNWVN